MPWKIKNLSPSGEDAYFHIHDPQNDLHVITELNDGTVHVCVGGGGDYESARLHVTIYEDGLEAEARGQSERDTMIARNILGTMGFSRKDINEAFHRLPQTKRLA